MALVKKHGTGDYIHLSKLMYEQDHGWRFDNQQLRDKVKYLNVKKKGAAKTESLRESKKRACSIFPCSFRSLNSGKREPSPDRGREAQAVGGAVLMPHPSYALSMMEVEGRNTCGFVAPRVNRVTTCWQVTLFYF